MYEIYERLLKQKGIRTADVCRATGVPAPTFSDWKKGKSKPNADKLILIAEYFGVSVEYLRTGKEKSDSNYSADTAHLVAQIRKDAELTEALKKYFSMSEEQKKHVIATINMISKK